MFKKSPNLEKSGAWYNPIGGGRGGLSTQAGAGLRALLDSQNDFDEAYHTCINSLLADVPTTRDQLLVSGLRLMQDAVEPLNKGTNLNKRGDSIEEVRWRISAGGQGAAEII